jgi:hypothetical protein
MPKKTPLINDDPDQNVATQNTSNGDRLLNKQLIGRRMIRDAADFVKTHISKQPPVQRFFSFMPTMLTRVSPFHFRSRTRPSEWPLVRLDSGNVNSWGRMVVVGELLIIFDETILFCLLTLLTRYQNDAFETTMNELCRLANIQSTAHQQKIIWKSIQRLAGTRIDLELTSGSGKKLKSMKEMTGSILSFADMDRRSGRIRVVVNPYFIEMYAESFVTNIDLHFRASLKSDISKAFYRFFQGQYDIESTIEITKLARSVNLDVEQPMDRMRAKVRIGLKELESRGYLEHFDITKDNLVLTRKAKNTALDIDNPIFGTRRTDAPANRP